MFNFSPTVRNKISEPNLSPDDDPIKNEFKKQVHSYIYSCISPQSKRICKYIYIYIVFIPQEVNDVSEPEETDEEASAITAAIENDIKQFAPLVDTMN